MKNNKKVNTKELLKLYKRYLTQAHQNLVKEGNFINNLHDDSGGHPDYHCDQHDNTPSKIIIKEHK